MGTVPGMGQNWPTFLCESFHTATSAVNVPVPITLAPDQSLSQAQSRYNLPSV